MHLHSICSLLSLILLSYQCVVFSVVQILELPCIWERVQIPCFLSPHGCFAASFCLLCSLLVSCTQIFLAHWLPYLALTNFTIYVRNTCVKLSNWWLLWPTSVPTLYHALKVISWSRLLLLLFLSGTNCCRLGHLNDSWILARPSLQSQNLSLSSPYLDGANWRQVFTFWSRTQLSTSRLAVRDASKSPNLWQDPFIFIPLSMPQSLAQPLRWDQLHH